MNVYQYIATNNPSFAKSICNQYGYRTVNIRSNADLAVCLAKLVNAEGEPAFKDIMNGHPDKDVILELYAAKPVETHSSADGTRDYNGYGCMNGCGCRSCQQRQMNHYMNADGGGTRESSATSLTSVSIIAAAMILAVAVLTNNK